MNNEVVDPHLTATIVVSYVRHHAVGADQVSDLITSVHRALGQLGKPTQPEEAPTPAVSVRQSVRHDYVVCLDCGYKGKMLQRHIGKWHGLSRDEYFQRWGLRSDHPLIAPAYAEQRSAFAKARGFGRKPAAQETSAPPATAISTPVAADPKSGPKPTPRRSTRSASKSEVLSEAAVAPTPARQRRSRSKTSPAIA
jgi:predicted transcriptional regulator